ncbi:hypothetical protein [Bradyrhizobium sp. OAE829]|uniref:hypothetical protein n=1 Tax=Bradyrhizobium sp. OAE829 TaxID=2663807 RepID=UPI00178B3325
MRAASSRIWFSTSTNQPVNHSNNQQADHSRHADQSIDDRQTDQHDLDKRPQATPYPATDTAPVSPVTHRGYSGRNGFQSNLVAGYSQIITDRVQDGWSCHLITVMFSQVFGPRAAVLDKVKDQVQRIYSTLLTRVHRKPRTAPTDELPILVGALDLPVYKRDRSLAPSFARNNGLHFHGIVLLPPRSRLKEPLVDHFRDNPELYVGEAKQVERVDVKPVTHDHEWVVDYVLKTVLNGRLSLDDAILVLPRARAELHTEVARYSAASTPLARSSAVDCS